MLPLFRFPYLPVRKQNLGFYLDQVPELFIKGKEEHKSSVAVMQLLTVNQPLG